MRTLQIARKDFMDTVRGRQLYFLVALFGIIGAAAGYTVSEGIGEVLLFSMLLLVPLLGLVFTQHTIAGKHKSDEMAVLLGLPFSRLSVVVGTYLGRIGLLVVSLLCLYLSAILFGVFSGARFDPQMLAGGFLMLLVLGAVFISIALGISSATTSTTAASIASIVTYLVFVFQLWTRIPDVILYAVNGFDSPDIRPIWADVFVHLSPFAALRNAVAPVFEGLASDFPLLGVDIPPAVPFYMEQWFGLLVLSGWLVLPVLLGYLKFSRRDL